MGLNFIDIYNRSGLYPVQLPSGLGGEAAGVVEEVGPGVTDLRPGDRVAYGSAPLGAYAEGRLIPADRLIKLPDGSGLWLTTTRYLTPAGTPLHEKGIEPAVVVDEPDVEFGQPAPATDAALDKALERFSAKKAA